MKRIDHLRLLLIALGAVTLAMFLTVNGRAGWVFPHAKHLEASGVACVDCHTSAAASKSGKDELRPKTDTCINCHTSEDLTNFGYVEPGNRPSGFSKFSHEAHLAKEGVDCARCHGALVDKNIMGTGKGAIGHAVCFECHDGHAAPNECEGCHDNIERVRPLDHEVDYVHTHQFSARGAAQQCEQCHRESTLCSDCHTGDNVLFMTHDRNFIFTHAEPARKTKSTACLATRRRAATTATRKSA